ncbi:MAG: protein translocase SEC61 complex subunit gamma [Thaumarchaeota archaeon]|nr:protein translocase SEC61 complex subunit gamma [Nitrososphaerota archaeon]
MRRSIDSAVNTLKLARKSDLDEFMLYLKLIFLGIVIVGTIGFVIQFVGAILKLG